MDRDARLLPWLDALKQYVHMTARPSPDKIDDALASGVVWLTWTAHPAPNQARPAAFFRAFEALELLALLANADYDAWLCVVKEVWPKAATFWADVFYPKKYQLGVEVHVKRVGELTKWAQRAFITDVMLTSLHEAYASVREELQAHVLRRGESIKAEIRVGIVPAEDPDDDREDNFSLLLFEATQVAQAEVVRRSLTHFARGMRSLFRLVKVWVESVHTLATWKEVYYAEEITACGVQVPVLCFDQMDFMERPSARQTITSLRHLLVLPEKHGLDPPKSVCVDPHASHPTLDAIFSSPYYSTTVQELLLEPVPQARSDQDRLMYWLALCAFGGNGCPSLEYVRLEDPSLQMAHVEVLERTLRQDDALVQLFGCSNMANEDRYRVVKASKFVLIRPSGPTELSTIDLDIPLENLRVLSIGDEWVSVLLPGWGQAWVHRSDVSVEKALDEGTLAPSIRRLDVEIVNKPVVLKLLQSVGINLVALMIDWETGEHPFSATSLRVVCRSCPILNDIMLIGAGADSLDILGQCYDEGLCRAGRLSLDVRHVLETVRGPLHFFLWLTDENHSLTKHLREIYLEIRTREMSDHVIDLLMGAAMMLKRNRLLWNLTIRIELTSDDSRHAAQQTFGFLAANFVNQDREKVAVRVAPLRIEKKNRVSQ